MKNTQDPIARRTEIIFNNILFTTVALELFGLVFLIFKLIFLPFFNLVYQKLSETRVGLFNEEGEDKCTEKRSSHLVTETETQKASSPARPTPGSHFADYHTK